MKFIRNLWAILVFIYTHPLNRKHRFAAIMNFVRWQVGMRLIKKKVVLPWVEDAKFLSGLGEFGLTGNIYCGFMEYEDMLFLLHVLRPQHTFVDVGANVGAYTILASQVVGSKSIAFEPLPETVMRLKNQVQINRIENMVDVRNMGVGDEEGELFFTNNGDTVNKVNLSGTDENTTRVRVGILDRELELNNEYFIKIDVEGFESRVIRGAERILSSGNVVAMIVELNGRGVEFGSTNEEVHQKIIAHGLIPISYDPATREIKKLDGFNKNEGNTLYVRSVEEARGFVKTAPKRVVHTANAAML